MATIGAQVCNVSTACTASEICMRPRRGQHPPTDDVPIRCCTLDWKGERSLPYLLRPSLTRLGSRAAVLAAPLGNGLESKVVPPVPRAGKTTRPELKLGACPANGCPSWRWLRAPLAGCLPSRVVDPVVRDRGQPIPLTQKDQAKRRPVSHGNNGLVGLYPLLSATAKDAFTTTPPKAGSRNATISPFRCPRLGAARPNRV